jgi:precorrin isomerase
MDRSTLVSIDLNEGAEVVSALENGGVHVKVALWMVTPQYEDGRLIIASEDLPQNEILVDYEKVVAILQGKFFRTLPLFSILRMDDPLIQDLRKRFGNTKSVQGMRLGGQVIGNKYIEDAYVYKIE